MTGFAWSSDGKMFAATRGSLLRDAVLITDYKIVRRKNGSSCNADDLGIIFLAEMGDKTQLAAMTMSAQTKKPWAVFIGASLALAAVSAIGVLVGGLSAVRAVGMGEARRRAAFIVIGVLMLMGKF